MKYQKFNLKEIKIEVTHHCNLNCIHCSSDASSSNSIEMNEDDCMRLIAEASNMGVKQIEFSGGEPLLWEPLERTIEKSSKSGIESIIYSNGNHPNIHKRIINFRELGVTKCIFSLYGASQNVHEKVTMTANSFNNTIEAMLASVAAGLPTEIHFVPLSFNYNELNLIAILAKKLSIQRISVLRFVPHGRGKDIMDLVLNLFKNRNLKSIINNLRRSGFNIRTGSPYNFFGINNQQKCTAGIDKLTIGPNLNIYPCDAFKQITAEQIAGSSNYSNLKFNSMKECWQKSDYLNAVRAFINSNYDEPCESCKFLDKCFSGCLAQKVIYFGFLSKRPDPSCLYFS